MFGLGDMHALATMVAAAENMIKADRLRNATKNNFSFNILTPIYN
jgi:hypothetical protein